MYDPSYVLLKESRESWDYVLTHKVVYSLDPAEIAGNSLSRISELYLEGNVWIEVHILFHGERGHYLIILEADHRTQMGRHAAERSMERNPSMLIDVAKTVQLPEQMASDGRSIATTVRLKRFNDHDCICGNPLRKGLETFPGLAAERDVLVENRKLSVSRVVEREFCESPDKLVEGGAKAVQDIPHYQVESVGGICGIYANDVDSVFNIILTDKGVGFRFVEGFKLFPEQFKVFLRPTCLQVGIA